MCDKRLTAVNYCHKWLYISCSWGTRCSFDVISFVVYNFWDNLLEANQKHNKAWRYVVRVYARTWYFWCYIHLKAITGKFFCKEQKSVFCFRQSRKSLWQGTSPSPLVGYKETRSWGMDHPAYPGNLSQCK